MSVTLSLLSYEEVFFSFSVTLNNLGGKTISALIIKYSGSLRALQCNNSRQALQSPCDESRCLEVQRAVAVNGNGFTRESMLYLHK